jgi:hypothetical protein
MPLRSITLCCLAGVFILAGCSHAPRTPEVKQETVASEPAPPATPPAPVVVPEPRVEPPEPARPAVSHKRNTPLPVRDDLPALKPGEHRIGVESEPAGATVVMNGKPCGKTPCVLIVQANRRGFLREAVSIKVRFIAANESEESLTVEEVLTTLDKVPAGIRFTAAGATRMVR